MPKRDRRICILHDIERGWGHRDVDPAFARRADREAPGALDAMLRIERDARISATYCVVGAFLSEVRHSIERDGHCLAFHSYDHDCAAERRVTSQLRECRRVDATLAGYRAPRSLLGPDLEETLREHKFAWLASSARSLGSETPVLRRGIVWIPVHFDDYPLYREGLSWNDWEQRALLRIEASSFVAFGLHDCYAHLWLPNYAKFLDRVKDLGRLVTLQSVAADVRTARHG